MKNKSKPVEQRKSQGEIILFQADDGQTKVQVRLEENTVWLTQKTLSNLYQISVSSVNEHLTHIYEEGELSPEATIRKFRIVRTEGKRDISRIIEHYNLEAILAVGYRVRSNRGTQFRQWAIRVCRGHQTEISKISICYEIYRSAGSNTGSTVLCLY